MLKEFLQDFSTKNRLLKTIYQLIHKYGTISKNDLLKEIPNLTQTTLFRMVDEMLSQGLIEECGVGKSFGGRPPVLYRINSAGNYLIGIDITRVNTRVLLFDIAFRQVDAQTFSMTFEHTPNIVLSHIIQIIGDFMEKHGFTTNELLGIGVGSVGPIDRNRGIILEPKSFPAPGWYNVPVVDTIQKVYPVKIMMENGANTAAFGEYTHTKMEYQNVLYCISGQELRCGIIANGQMLRDKTGGANTYSHIIINVEGLRCICGRRGCLEAYMSFNSIFEEIESQIKLGNKSWITEEIGRDFRRLSIHHLIEAAKAGDQLVNDIILKSAFYYGIGIANMVNLTHPDLVILNGPLIYELPSYFEKVVSTSLHYLAREEEIVRISQGSLKSSAAATGAANMIFQSFFDPSSQIDLVTQ